MTSGPGASCTMVVTSTGVSTFSSFFCLLLISSADCLTVSPAFSAFFSCSLPVSSALAEFLLGPVKSLSSISLSSILAASLMCSTVVGMPCVPASMPATREANLPFGLSSTAINRRSRFDTKPFSSCSSRSSRCFSSLRIGMRDSAQRSVGGMAMVVMIAMATIMVKRFWLSAPIDRPMVAMITSVEPRAFMPQASAKPSRRVRPPSSGADEGAAELAEAGDQDQPDGEQRNLRVGEDGEIGAQAGNAEEHRRKERGDQAAQLLVDMTGEDRGFADQNAGDEGAEHGVHADQIGDQRHAAHDDEDRGDHGEFADEGVVDPADDEKHDASADRQARDHEQEACRSRFAPATRHRPRRATPG